MILCITHVHEMSAFSVDMTQTLRVMELHFGVASVDQTKFAITNHMETLKCVFSNYNNSVVGAV